MSEQTWVLAVDDDPLNLDVIESCLYGQGYSFLRASSGQEALEAVAKQPPDIVLLDLMMPGMDGFEVCSRIKGNSDTRFIPVVVITSLDGRDEKLRAIQAGADDFITKPVDRLEVLARTKSLLSQKFLHDQLHNKYEENLQLQTLKDNLVNMLAHDFRNPLTGIIGYLNLLDCEELKSDCDLFSQYVNSALYLARRMTSMVSDMLDLNRLEKNLLPLRLEKVSLRGVIEESLNQFRYALFEKKLSVSVEESDTRVAVNADSTLLVRVIGNILANSVRYSPEGGSISFHITKEEGSASLTITNEGPFIPEECLSKIFEKFYQAEARAANTRSGAGLGLAFCDLVVNAHGGSITAANNPDKGCRFVLAFPLVSEEGA